MAVDVAKCYDSIRLPFLRRVLSAAGWPAGVLEPLLAAYAFRRRLRIGDAVGLGAEGLPTSQCFPAWQPLLLFKQRSVCWAELI